MVGRARWLALEVTDLDRVRHFYESTLDLAVREERERELRLAAGDAEIRLRESHAVPRGGLHTHYALSIPPGEYEAWRDRLAATGRDVAERSFGDVRSAYCTDPAGHCVELATDPAADAGESATGSGVEGLFEVVLEVEDLDAATAVYRTLGFEPVGDGGDQRRVRLTSGGVDLELWAPRLGVAGGQGGVHVDWGLSAADASRAARRVATDVLSVEAVDDGVRVRDVDGHYVTLC